MLISIEYCGAFYWNSRTNYVSLLAHYVWGLKILEDMSALVVMSGGYNGGSAERMLIQKHSRVPYTPDLVPWEMS